MLDATDEAVEELELRQLGVDSARGRKEGEVAPAITNSPTYSDAVSTCSWSSDC